MNIMSLDAAYGEGTINDMVNAVNATEEGSESSVKRIKPMQQLSDADLNFAKQVQQPRPPQQPRRPTGPLPLPSPPPLEDTGFSKLLPAVHSVAPHPVAPHPVAPHPQQQQQQQQQYHSSHFPNSGPPLAPPLPPSNDWVKTNLNREQLQHQIQQQYFNQDPQRTSRPPPEKFSRHPHASATATATATGPATAPATATATEPNAVTGPSKTFTVKMSNFYSKNKTVILVCIVVFFLILSVVLTVVLTRKECKYEGDEMIKPMELKLNGGAQSRPSYVGMHPDSSVSMPSCAWNESASVVLTQKRKKQQPPQQQYF